MSTSRFRGEMTWGQLVEELKQLPQDEKVDISLSTYTTRYPVYYFSGARAHIYGRRLCLSLPQGYVVQNRNKDKHI